MNINTIQNILPRNIIDDILHDSRDLPWGFIKGKRTDNKRRNPLCIVTSRFESIFLIFHQH